VIIDDTVVVRGVVKTDESQRGTGDPWGRGSPRGPRRVTGAYLARGLEEDAIAAARRLTHQVTRSDHATRTAPEDVASVEDPAEDADKSEVIKPSYKRGSGKRGLGCGGRGDSDEAVDAGRLRLSSRAVWP